MNKEETAGLNKSSRVAIVIMMVLVATGLDSLFASNSIVLWL